MGFNLFHHVVFSIDDIDITTWMIISFSLMILLLIIILVLSIKYHKKKKKNYTEIEDIDEPEEIIQLISKEEFLHDELQEEKPTILEENKLNLEVQEEKEMAAKKETTKETKAKETKVKETKAKKEPEKKDTTKKVAPKKEEPKKETKKKTAKKQTTLEADLEHMRESASASYRSKVYHISLRDDGKWQVKFAKGEKVIKTFATQLEAIEYAKKLADNQDGSIAIHKKDGKIRKLKY